MQVEWIKSLHAMRVGMENSSSWKESPGLKFCNTGTMSSTLGSLCIKLYDTLLSAIYADWKKRQREQGGLISCEGEGLTQIASSNTFLTHGWEQPYLL